MVVSDNKQLSSADTPTLLCIVPSVEHQEMAPSVSRLQILPRAKNLSNIPVVDENTEPVLATESGLD